MRRTLLVCLGLVAVFASVPAYGMAQTVAQDSVRGNATVVDPSGTLIFGFDAFSGPNGEGAGGTVAGVVSGQVIVANVTCLSVAGNRAVIGLYVPFTNFDTYFLVVDGGPGKQDEFGGVPSAGPAIQCATFSGFVTEPIESGDIVVTDGPGSPTSKDQCKNGGWRSYGATFKNQGTCVAFVQRGPRG